MKILITAADSFTGHHFTKALAAAGHEVVAACRIVKVLAPPEERKRFISTLGIKGVRAMVPMDFNSDSFLKTLEVEKFDVWCQHAATVRGHRLPTFPVLSTVERDTKSLINNVKACAKTGTRIILTGTYFEEGEGGADPIPGGRHNTAGDFPRAASAYGLAKTLVRKLYQFYCEQEKVPLDRFVIPNPFGPLESSGTFTSYLARNWFAKETPVVRTPGYVRDNIPVDVLAKEYVKLVEDLRFLKIGGNCRIPRGFVMNNISFARMFAGKMEEVLNIPCPLKSGSPEACDIEVPVRCNWHETDAETRDDTQFWKELGEYYQEMYSSPSK